MSQAQESQKEESYTGGIEGKLDVCAGVILILSLIVAAIVLVSAMIAKPGYGKDDSFATIGLAIGIGFQGVVLYLVFQAGAEIIRLLKKLNGLPYAGKISKAKGTATDDDRMHP